MIDLGRQYDTSSQGLNPLKTIRFQIIAALVCAALLAACSSPPPKPPPKFTGHLLLLAGEDPNNRTLFELTERPESAFLVRIAEGVLEAVATPDRSRILFATKDDIRLYTLDGMDTKTLVTGSSFCLAWSPDGQRFSYKQSSGARTTLYVSDLGGKTRLVWEDSSGNETVNKSCAHWVATEKLVFDRLGASQVKGNHIKPNTMTLATLGNSVSLTDAERKWSVEGICKDGTAYLRSLDQGEIVIAKTLENPKTAKPVPGPCSSCRFIGFAADSCVPFFVSQSLSTTTDLFSLNPTNWQKLRTASIQQTFSLNARFVIKSSARLMVAGDAPDKLVLIDTESGDIVKLAPAAGTIQSPVPIVWIEN